MVLDDHRFDLVNQLESIRISLVAVRDQRVRVAVGSGQPLGFSTVVPLGDRAAEFDALFVDPEWAGMGVDEILIADAAVIARDDGISRLEITAMPHQRDLFVRNGFSEHELVTTPRGTRHRMSATTADLC